MQSDILYDLTRGIAVRVHEKEALALAAELLEQRGVPPARAALQARVLVDAELKGHPSHGLQRLPRLLLRIERRLIDPATEGVATWRSNALLEADGCDGLGPVVALAALRQAAGRVAPMGVVLVAIRNANHLGMLAYYVEEMAAAGHIAIALSSSEALVHPHGGRTALIGTNPIAIAVPAGDGPPLVVDLATSKVSMGKVHHHAATGRPLEPGWAKDADGQPTTDAARARDGSIAPFGEAKGYALGLALEVLIAAVTGAALAPEVGGTLDADVPCNKGDVFLLIQPRRCPGLAERLGDYLDLVRRSPADDPAVPVAVPGDGARRRKAAARRSGFDVDPALMATLADLSMATPSLRRGAAR